MQQIWENIPAMRFTTDSTCGFRPKGSSMLISGINLLFLSKVIPSLLLHTRNSMPLHVLNHSRVGIVGFYCAERPAFYPELCLTSGPNVFSHQVLWTLSQQQQANAEDGTPCTSRTAFQHKSIITKHLNNNHNFIRLSLRRGKTTFLIGHFNLL